MWLAACWDIGRAGPGHVAAAERLLADTCSGAARGDPYHSGMKGDRVEAVVDTGQGVQTFEIVATRAGRRIEVVTSRGVVEVREVTRTGVPVRTGRFMTTRLIALVEHPAADERGRVEVTTRHRLQPTTRAGTD
jgi:hypothetical protein